MPTPGDVKSWEDRESEATDMAQAYRDLARGEQTAAALEANLSVLHSRLDAMLAGLEPKEAAVADASLTGPAAATITDETAGSNDEKPQDGGGEKKKQK
ncbi:Uncharacterized protein TCAP_05538 [Tolypocladium capitatum]|uniref:Uncharacterized protein n=1 Tax=Tolypocladium capitatum TaxID=45235 RepID=A0A2K3QAI7_9HYPO|nr:Uncharacterized protein TCAP_05538 [Tolypocladium capitatum]